MANRTIAHRARAARIVTSDAEIDRGIQRAHRLRNEPLVKAVEYRPGAGLDLLILQLSDGTRRVFPRENLQGLQSGTKEQIANIEIVGGGTGLHWPELNADLYVPALLLGAYGNKQWMAKIGRQGGLARSAPKKRASRANGKLGGRPKSANIGA